VRVSAGSVASGYFQKCQSSLLKIRRSGQKFQGARNMYRYVSLKVLLDFLLNRKHYFITLFNENWTVFMSGY